MYLQTWTVTTNGSLSANPYYLRIIKDANPNATTTYSIGDSGLSAIDQRLVVDTSYLELVRLDVKAADDPNIVQILDVVDSTAVVGPFSTLPQEPPEERAQSGHSER